MFASSSSVYGDVAAEIKREETPVRPLAPYPLQKFAGEQYAALFTRLHGLKTVSLRLFNVFGARQSADGDYAAVIPRFCAAARVGRPPLVFGDGSQARDFTPVSNVTEAFLTVARAPASAVAGRVFNVGAGQAVTLLELAREVNSAFGTSLAPEFAPARAGEVYRTQADISALLALGYRPQTTFRDGLRALAARGI
jgi:UDP-glucose 4-epimerase